MVVHAGGQKLEEITLSGEVEKTMKLLVDSIPEKIRSEVHDRLMVAFGIRKLSDYPDLQRRFVQTLPNGQRKGARWNKITSWYSQFNSIAPNRQVDQGASNAPQSEPASGRKPHAPKQ